MIVRYAPLVRNVIDLGLSRVIPILVGLVSFPLLAKLLPIEEFGRLSLVTSTVNLASLAGGTWLSSAIHRYYTSYSDSNERRALDHWIFFRAIPLSGLVAALAVMGLALAYPAALSLFVVAAGTMFFQTAYATIVSILQAKFQFRASMWAEAGRGAVYVVLLVVLVMALGFGALGAVLAVFISALLISGVLLWRISPPLQAPHGAFAMRFFAYGLPMTASSLCSWVTQMSDRWFLLANFGERSVGAYSANYSLVDYLVRYPMGVVLTLASLTLFRQTGDHGPAKALKQMRSARPLVLGVGLVLAAVPMVFGQSLIGLLATDEYREPWVLQTVLAVGMWLQVVAMFEGIALQIRHRTGIIFAGTLLSALVNLFANFLLIPKMGPIGAAFATAVSYAALAMAMIVACAFAKRRPGESE